jgi:hypothetical protein
MDFSGQEITERLLKIAEFLRIKDVLLAKELGVPKQHIPKFRSNETSIPPWRVINFLKKHREINSDWILFGDGEMFSKAVKHNMMMTEDGFIFTNEIEDKKSESEENKKLNALLEEKEKQIEMQKEIISIQKDALENQKQTVQNQDDYIKKLLERL